MPTPTIPQAKSLEVQVKSDLKRLPDDDLVQALVCLANTQGGELWLWVDKIYRGMLRFGRTEPDYSRTDGTGVALDLATGQADEDFLGFVIDLEKKQRAELPTDILIVLAALRKHKRLSAGELARHIQREPEQVEPMLQPLIEAKLIKVSSAKGVPVYALSAQGYFTEKGRLIQTLSQLDGDQPELIVRSYLLQQGRITRKDVVQLCRVSQRQATWLLSQLTAQGVLIVHGQRRGAFYTLGKSAGV